MTEKMTYVHAIEIAIGAVEDVEVKEKLDALKVQLERKAEHRKPRVNKDKIELADKVYAIMEPGVAYRVAELGKVLGVSTQKLTPAMGLLIEDGRAQKVMEKRVAFYTAVAVDAEGEDD